MTISKRISGATIIATANPTVTDDKTKGHYVGERWLNGTSEFVCTDPATGAAVWTAAGGGGGGTVNSVTAGNGSITIGGTGVDPTVKVAATAVTAGSYTNTNLTVGADGRITAASNGSGGGGGGGGTITNGYQALVAAEATLVGYWRCDDAFGSGTIADYTTTNDLTNLNMTTGAAGMLTGSAVTAAQALTSGIGAKKAVPTGIPLVAAARTLEAIFKTTATTAAAIAIYGTTGTRNAFGICINAGGSGNVAAVAYGDDIIVGGLGFLDGLPHHLVATYDGANTMELWLDGIRVGTRTLAAPLTTTLSTDGFQISSSGGFLTGPLDGRVSDVALYSSVLSNADILAHYKAMRASS